MYPWFKPKRFWKVFAAYYPVSWQGFAVSIVLLILASLLCLVITSVWLYLACLIILALVFDLICFRTGEYPSWWKHRAGLHH